MDHGFIVVCYPDGKEVPTISMGNGTVRVTTVLFEESNGFAGVAFSPAPENDKIGVLLNPDAGSPITDLDLRYQMIFTRLESIDVVINRLQEAKDSMIGAASLKNEA